MKEKLRLIQSYLLAPKIVLGVVLILFAFYTTASTVPESWKKYWSTQSENDTLAQSKKNLSKEEAKLKAISEELDKLSAKVVTVESGNSPELVVIDVAQKVVDLCESTQNVYISLRPNQQTVLDVDGTVTLPVNIPGDPTASSSGRVRSTAAGPEAEKESKSALKAFHYVLVVKGTYASLATFINEVSKLPTLILIKSVKISNKPEVANMSLPTPGPDELYMNLEFAVPWK